GGPPGAVPGRVEREQDDGRADALAARAEEVRRDRAEPALARHELLAESLLDAREILGDRWRVGGGRGGGGEGLHGCRRPIPLRSEGQSQGRQDNPAAAQRCLL